MAGLIVSAALAAIGFWFATAQTGEMAVLGWVMLILGVVLLTFNLSLYRGGFRMPRRRRR